MTIEKKLQYEYERKPIAAIGCFFIGAINITLLIYFLSPAAARFESAVFYEEFIANPYFSYITWSMLVATSIVSLSAILPAVNAQFKEEKSEWLQISSLIAIIGWGILAASFLTLLGRIPELAEQYTNGNQVIKDAIVAIGLPELDPHEILAMGGPGLWFISVNILAIIKKKWSPILAAFGILCGVSYIATVFASLFVFEPLNYVAIGGGALAAPVWNIWQGVLMIRRKRL